LGEDSVSCSSPIALSVLFCCSDGVRFRQHLTELAMVRSNQSGEMTS
jgi:hypothetical protein